MAGAKGAFKRLGGSSPPRRAHAGMPQLHKHLRSVLPAPVRMDSEEHGAVAGADIPLRCRSLPNGDGPSSGQQVAAMARRVLRSKPQKNKLKFTSRGFSAPSDAASKAQARMLLKRLVGRGSQRGQDMVEGWQKVVEPPIARHSLGSCAVVGLSSRILGSCLGKAIDSHDTVFRFGPAPVRGWERDVGTQKSVQLARKPSQSKCSDIDHDVWFKGGQIKEANSSAADQRPPTEFYLVMGESTGKCDKHHRPNKFKGVAVRYLNDRGVLHATQQLYAKFSSSIGRAEDQYAHRMKATSGFNFVVALLISQACRRVDLYGFGHGEGGHYFLGRQAGGSRKGMKAVHSLELEYWLLRQAMSEALLCYYDREVLATGATC